MILLIKPNLKTEKGGLFESYQSDVVCMQKIASYDAAEFCI